MSSASNLFMQIDGVKGIVTDKQYKEWIAIDHASMGVHSQASIDNGSGQLNSSGVHFEDISVAKALDATSTQLVDMVAQGTNVKKVIIALNVKTDNKDNEICRWEFENCIFTSHNVSLHNSNGIPDEQLAMVFGSVKFQTSMITSEGSTSKQGPVGWDQVTNTKL
ncbi:Hcp family type VI secretion system effector [Pantoea agglomerans]|uniref:Hcp family type VI secretion system effector n=1 Tax=Enterobacter agglomerans TaxID=549 RepID=UPI00241339CA|nr:type VI secretion system tube protein Hcp [Pantoea agglomerans]